MAGLPLQNRTRTARVLRLVSWGGALFDTTRQDALKLAKIWQACSRASLHPTMDTNHDPLGANDVANALRIVLAHLETALYKPSGRDLWKIVREQEELAIARAHSGQPTNAPGLGARTDLTKR